ncbi:thiamine-phosphate kinase [Leucobacter luti]|uniref:Thiamine-monophosphate kinase n=1 Tax=Leucobacter luti TaxID=340320 RepID=A0A4V3CXH6_9MICO|nr:thiamine-phosphate kinase [Leucobacter luti]TDP90298.1 thiamine-phosphate kinase [Leucobacter luti]
MTLTVGELGESGVLRRILSRLDAAQVATLGPGDDCAVLGVRGELVITTDTMIEGPDFRAAWHSGWDLGWKLAATNLSDVAAMGARPIALTLALAVPRDTPVELLEAIATGMNHACQALAPGCGVVGGDLGTAPVITAAVTALGELSGRPAVTRAGARAGDTLAYAGDLGLAGLGLSLLFAEAADKHGNAQPDRVAELKSASAVNAETLAAQLTPTPPVGLGVVAATSGATAMMDISDSLSIDADRLARASGVRVELESELLLGGFGSQRGVDVPVAAMLTGGEDHGLLATFPADVVIPAGFAPIGRVLAAHLDPRVTLDGEPQEPAGWDPYVLRWPGA